MAARMKRGTRQDSAWLIPWRRLALVSLALMAGVETAATAPSQGEHQSLETLVVVGNRTQPRSAIYSPAPVDVFSRDDLQATGATGNELGEALAAVAPSFSFPRQSNSVTSDHIRAARLRNLGPDQVLVLVNGKRRHPSAVVNDNTTFGKGSNAFDFNTIPLSAVKRVEILRDGASAQYGSDAIAGVINIILEDAPEGGEWSVGGGSQLTDFPITDETLTDGETFHVAGHHGIRLDDEGFLRGGLEYRERNTTNRAGLNRVPAFVAPPTVNNLAFRGQQTSRSGDPLSEEMRLWVNGRYPAGDVDVYFHGTLLEQDTEGAVLFRHPDSNQNVRALYPDGTRPVTTGDNSDFGLTVGGEFGAGAWSFDSSVSYGRNQFEFGVKNSLNPSLGPSSPTQFDSGRFTLEQLNVRLDAMRELRLGALGVDLATGVAYRDEDFRSEPGDEASFAAGDFRFDRSVTLEDGSVVDLELLVGAPDIGAQGAKGITPRDAADIDRGVYGVYVDASSQVSERLFMNVAARFEDYDDFGNTLNGKLSGIYALTPVLSLRASVSNSFRAPSLSQLAWSRSDNTFDRETFERVSSRLVRAESEIGRTLGVAHLQEEDARNVSVGITARPIEGLSLTLDAFRIDIDDRISISEFLQGQTLIDTVQDLPGGEGVRSISFFTNAIDTRSDGIELVVDWNMLWAGGDVNLNAAWSYVDTDITGLRDAPPALTAIDPDAQLFESGAINVLTTASPDNQAVLKGTWENDKWRLMSRARHYGSVIRDRGFAAQEFDPDTLIDLAVSRSFRGDWSVTVGADNVFDHLPDRSSPSLDFGGNFAYEVITPAGTNGRFVYMKATIRY